MMIAQAATEGMGFLEHPDEPDPQLEGLPPSIWKLPILQILRRHSSFSLLHLKQGYYGAKSPKPTVIMVVCSSSNLKTVPNTRKPGTEAAPATEQALIGQGDRRNQGPIGSEEVKQ